MNKIFYIVLLLLTFGCGATDISKDIPKNTSNIFKKSYLKHPLAVDIDFSDKHIDQILSSIDDWREATDYMFDPSNVIIGPTLKTDQYSISKVNGLNPDIIFRNQEDDNNKTTVGTHSNKKISIYIYSEGVNIKSTVSHELGHYLGLSFYNENKNINNVHTEDELDIMYPGVQPYYNTCISKKDINAFCMNWNCSDYNPRSLCAYR